MTLDPTSAAFRSRFVDILPSDGKRVFAVACGESVCNGTTFEGRFIDVTGDGTRVFATASEGCQPPIDPAAGGVLDADCFDPAAYLAALGAVPFLVEADHLPPYGLSRVLMVRLSAVAGCVEKDCLTSYLIYNEPGSPPTLECAGEAVPAGHGWWTGCVGDLDVVFWITDDATPTGRVCVSGCNLSSGGTAYGVTIPACPLGATLQVDGQIPATDCCACENGNALLGMTIRSFCGPVRMARFVDVAADGKRVFAVAACEGPPTCTPTDQACCDMLRGCDLVVTVSASGCCSDIAGSYPLVWGADPDGLVTWATAVGIEACGRLWHIEASCETILDVSYLTVRIFSSDPDCNCGPVATHTEEIVTCSPLEVSFTIPTECAEIGTPECDCEPTFNIAITL